VHDLLEQVLGEVGGVVDVPVHRIVHWDREDLVVRIAAVKHPHHADWAHVD
jgi:hypothetical protein